MKHVAPYADAKANQYNSSQVHHISAQGMPQNPGVKSFPGRPNLFTPEEEHPYATTITEGNWQWDRDAQRMSPGLYHEGEGGISGQSFYQNQISDQKFDSNQAPKLHTQEQDMEIGYEDNPSPRTFENLEQNFRNDITRLTKEHMDAEDAENDRHREKIIKINNDYQEKLTTLRAQHASRREEFLWKESHARFEHFQRVRVNHYKNDTPPNDINHSGFSGSLPPGGISAEVQQQYSGSHFDSYRQRHESFGRGRAHGADVRVPAPGGRVYSTGPRYY